MKMVKSLLLGTAAGLVAMTGAQAADLPVKAKPVQYVKICSLYGAGFYYIPGTDTCIKLGGWVRAEYDINAGGSFNPIKVSTYNRDSADNTIRARSIISVDVRNQTEYGTLRSYIAAGWQSTTTGTTTSTGTAAADAVYFPRGFVQLGGWTWGKAQSFYDFWNTPVYTNTTNVWGADSGGSGDTVAAYTAQLGNGLSATLSLEDPLYRRVGITGPGVANPGYAAGPQYPDLVGNLNVTQAWGAAQIMGAVHQVESEYYVPGVPSSGNPSDAYGWAIGGGLTLKADMIGKGDTFTVEGDYTKGALKYLGSGIGSFAISHGVSKGAGVAVDAIYAAAPVKTGLQLTSGWSVIGGYKHYWNPQWNTSLYASYGAIEYGNLAPAGSNWNYEQIGSRTVWTPVANLDLSVDVMYNKLGTNKVVATNTDQSIWQAIFRVQKNFWP